MGTTDSPDVRAFADAPASPARSIIGIDGSRATVGRRTGTERYSVEILAALADLHPTEPIRVYLNAPEPPPELKIPGTPVPIPAPRFWTLRNLAMEMRHNPPDVLFVPSHVMPPIHPRTVVTIHDLGYLVEPDCHQPIHRKQLEWTTRWNANAAAGLIAVSEATKRDLVEFLNVDPERIRVIHHGVAARMSPASPSAVEAVRARYKLGHDVLLAVGTIQPRKNLVRLIQAFEQLAPDSPSLELVVCGTSGWNAAQILRRAAASPFAERIHHLGYVPDVDLPALYSASSVLAFPSLYEGFGMPVLESMACGTPVVAANRSSLPEICGDAAILVDPFDSAAIANGIGQVLTDQNLRGKLVERGMQRARSYRWDKCAEQSLAFLRSIGDN